MNTNHDALREALDSIRFAARVLSDLPSTNQAGTKTREAWDRLNSSGDSLAIYLSQPMPEAAAQGWQGGLSNAELLTHWRRKVRRPSGPTGQELSAFALGVEVGVSISASPAAPEGATCNHAFVKPTMVFDDQVREGQPTCLNCGAVKPLHPQPQAQTTPSPDDIHSCGEFCDLPECVAARKAQAQGETAKLGLWDSQWVNVINAPELRDLDKEDAIHHAVKLAEQKCITNAREAIAQHRAALEECVEALKENNLFFDQMKIKEYPFGQAKKNRTSIAHANQVLEGGGK